MFEDMHNTSSENVRLTVIATVQVTYGKSKLS